MFYVQQEDRSWSLVEDIPATVDNRFGDKVFLQLPAPVIVHSTLFGRFEKPTPVLAVGISVREKWPRRGHDPLDVQRNRYGRNRDGKTRSG